MNLVPKSASPRDFAVGFEIMAGEAVRDIGNEPDDVLRAGIPGARSPAVHDALSYRTQSSGPGKPTSAARIRQRPTPSHCPTATAPRRNAELLPSGRGLIRSDSLFG